MPDPRVSIVVPAHNEAHRLRDTVLAIRETADLPHEIIVVDDASTDGCAEGLNEAGDHRLRVHRTTTPLGVAGARNLGANDARAPMVMFMDAHCTPGRRFLSTLAGALARLGRGVVVPEITVLGDPSARGFGMTLEGPSLSPAWLTAPLVDEPHPVPVGCGCLQMFFTAWFRQIGGYDRMRRYGVEDLEISMRSWLLGGPVHVVPKATVAHYFRSQTTCEVTWTDVVYNVLRFAHLHFAGPRLATVERHWAGHGSYAEARALLAASDVGQRRRWLDARRRKTADWYCDTFAIPI